MDIIKTGMGIPRPQKKHKHENNSNHVTKQQGNNNISSTTIVINFSTKSFFSIILNLNKFFSMCCKCFHTE